MQHKEIDSRLRTLRDNVKTARKEFDKTENDLKALKSVEQIIMEVLRQLDSKCCECGFFGLVDWWSSLEVLFEVWSRLKIIRFKGLELKLNVIDRVGVDW
ncbi:hypothetical protein KC19_VG300200 [Ceratodon purpureus]|uniref:Uncharacterized protein n=1 Tax=Ceratodon purpureus TaxID=3225 RepID=A0A8T0HVZ7_CERPU|nr:hypothetical protein KC19_VG300200 [Ceratodon purpureus]